MESVSMASKIALETRETSSSACKSTSIHHQFPNPSNISNQSKSTWNNKASQERIKTHIKNQDPYRKANSRIHIENQNLGPILKSRSGPILQSKSRTQSKSESKYILKRKFKDPYRNQNHDPYRNQIPRPISKSESKSISKSKLKDPYRN